MDGSLKAMLGTVTATEPLFGHQSLPTELPIAISQSVAETNIRDWHNIHPLRPAQACIHVAVALCEGSCRSSTIYYTHIENL